MATSTIGYPLTYPRFKAFTTAGALLAAGRVETYIAGTNTPLATYPTYADALAGTNANANPVILDAFGEATIFGQGGQAYKIILKTADGLTTLWTVDSIVLTDVPKSLTTVVKNGNQALGAVATKLTTWTVEVDALNEWSAANNRWTATYAGKYLVELQVSMTDAVTAVTAPIAYIYKNGGVAARANLFTSAINQGTTPFTHYTWIATAGDTIEAYAASGSANTVAQGTIATRLTIIGVA